MGDGDAYCPKVAGICGKCNPLCDFRLLCLVDCFHPSNYGGTVSFPARAPSTLVRMVEMCSKYLIGRFRYFSGSFKLSWMVWTGHLVVYCIVIVCCMLIFLCV